MDVRLHDLRAPFEMLRDERGDSPVAERAAGAVLALPATQKLGTEAQDFAVREIAASFGLV